MLQFSFDLALPGAGGVKLDTVGLSSRRFSSFLPLDLYLDGKKFSILWKNSWKFETWLSVVMFVIRDR